jgi:hypothetical protein
VLHLVFLLSPLDKVIGKTGLEQNAEVNCTDLEALRSYYQEAMIFSFLPSMFYH